MKKNRVITKYFPKIKKGISSLIKFRVYDKFHINPINAIEVYNIHKVFQLKSYKNNSLLDLLKSIFVNQNDYSKEVLSKIEFQVPKNSTLGIIGKNGSGKSTLLRLLANITSPSEGYILTKGKLAAIIDIGSGFHPELTGRENIRFYGKMIGMSEAKIKELTQTIIDFSELIDYIDQPIKFYSNGMYLRLAFSIVVHSNVDIILFDEVLTVGDNAFNIKCFQKIHELKKSTTIVLVSHNMEDIARVCDECILIDNGTIKMHGNPQETINYYLEYICENVEKPINHSNHYEYIFENKLEETQVLKLNIDGKSNNIYSEGIEYNEGICITINVQIDNLNQFLVPTINILDQSNNNVLTSSSMYQGIESLNINESGQFTIKCEIPPSLLNEGLYRINFFLVEQNGNIKYSKMNAAKFKIFINNQTQKYYLKKSSLRLSPSLQWDIVKSPIKNS